MKMYVAQIVAMTRDRASRRNLHILGRYLLVLSILIAIYTVVFRLLMHREGQDPTWLTGLYWTLTVMSTLGFGDITFHTDLGRAFSIIVLLTGMVFLLVLMPFTFIEFFYAPWMKAQAAARAPRRVEPHIRDHVIITHHDAVTTTLVRRLDRHKTPHVVVVQNADEAMRLQDEGAKIVVGDLDDPKTYERVGVDRAAMVVASGSDVSNSNVAFTVREVSPTVPIICTAENEASVDILELAGTNRVLSLPEMVGQSFARWTLGGASSSNVIGHVDGVLVAEAAAHGTPLVGKSLREIGLREETGVAVVGVWRRGRFQPARAETKIDDNTVLVLAGGKEHLKRYDEAYQRFSRRDTPVVILGGGRVGRATALGLAQAGLDYRIVEKLPEQAETDSKRWVVGDAAEIEVLREAGIETTQTVVVTTQKDDVNVYLTIYCRKLRPDIQILARATHERNVATLHRAGADFVLSYASMGATTLFNLMKRSSVLMVAEGLDVFRVRVPESLAGMTIAESGIRERTGCSVVAVGKSGAMQPVPNPGEKLAADNDLLLIGSIEAEERFLDVFPDCVASR